MRLRAAFWTVWGLGMLCAAAPRAVAQDDVADVPSRDIQIDKNDKKRYFLIGPAKDARPPKAGYKLLLVLPGGGGGADFNPFVKRIWKNALPKGYIVAQLVAPTWTEQQARNLVWPTRKQPCPEAKFDTETFIAEVIKDVKTRRKIDPTHVEALAWSSSGPAIHAAMLDKDVPLTGAFIAMSVFRPASLPDLKAAKGKAYYLYQSPDDKVCRFSFAESARTALRKAGATVTLVEYDGGHGWHGDIFGDIRRGMDWLASPRADAEEAKNSAVKNRSADQADKSAAKKGKKPAGENLLANGDFEKGLKGWTVINNSGRLTADVTDAVHETGKYSLAVIKTGGMPMDVIRCDLEKVPKGKVTVSARVKTKGVKNTFFKFFVYDTAGESLVDSVDVQRLSGTGDWKRIEKTFDIPDHAASAAVMIAVVLDGEMWFDDVRVERVE